MDYREASQQYAQGGIRAAMLLNSGAALAVLSQVSALPAEVRSSIPTAMTLWAVGTALGALSWLIGFLAARYVDKWQDEKNDSHRVTSNVLQVVGLIAVALAIGMFLGGSLHLARSL